MLVEFLVRLFCWPGPAGCVGGKQGVRQPPAVERRRHALPPEPGYRGLADRTPDNCPAAAACASLARSVAERTSRSPSLPLRLLLAYWGLTASIELCKHEQALNPSG